jgi:uncharacterized RDD family membrane protein YckC
MSDLSPNPYQTPAVAEGQLREPRKGVRLRTGSSGGARFLAAQIDHGFAVVLFFVAAMSLADERPLQVIPGVAAVSSYLGYYFLSEWLLGGTPGKLLFRLRVEQLTGQPCTARQIAIRTLLRLAEVNPVLLGALPAGVVILATERHQRIGDLIAGTVVVRR